MEINGIILMALSCCKCGTHEEFPMIKQSSTKHQTSQFFYMSSNHFANKPLEISCDHILLHAI